MAPTKQSLEERMTYLRVQPMLNRQTVMKAKGSETEKSQEKKKNYNSHDRTNRRMVTLYYLYGISKTNPS